MIEIGILLLTLMPVIGLAIFSIKKPPSWLPEGKLLPHWKKINLYSLLASVVLASLSYFWIHVDFIAEFKIINSLSISLLTFVFGQTIFTDGWQRLADRRVLRIANVISLVVGVGFLLIFDTQVMLMIYFLLALLATIIVFIPMIGNSDGRAIQLIVLSTFPILGLERIQWGLLLFVPIVLIYGLIVSIKNKSFKGFFTKISVPMVPIMIAPFLAVMLLPAF